MSFTGKMNAGMASVAKSMKNSVDYCKLEGKIAEQEKRIKVLTREIGNLAVVKLDAGTQMSPEIMERYTAIQEAREAIAALEQEKQAGKTEKTTCPACGAKTADDMVYCGKCGANVKEETSKEAIVEEVIVEEVTVEEVTVE